MTYDGRAVVVFVDRVTDAARAAVRDACDVPVELREGSATMEW